MAHPLPSLPWEVLYMIIDQIDCRHCYSVVSRTCKYFHSRLTPLVWETIHVFESHDCNDPQQADIPRRCSKPHVPILPRSRAKVNTTSGMLALPDRLYDDGPHVIWPHLFGIISTLIRKPSLRQHVRHLHIRKAFWTKHMKYPLGDAWSTSLGMIAGAESDFARGVSDVVRNCAIGSRYGFDEWIQQFSGPQFGDAYLAVLLALLTDTVTSINVLEGGAAHVDEGEEYYSLMFGWLSHHTSPLLNDNQAIGVKDRFPALRKMTVRYHSNDWHYRSPGRLDPFRFASRFHNVDDMIIRRGGLPDPLEDFGFEACPSISRLELDACELRVDFSDLEAILVHLPALATLCIMLDRNNYDGGVADDTRPDMASILNLEALMSTLAIRADSLQNLRIGLGKPKDVEWFPVDETTNLSLKNLTKLKRLHIDDGLYSACHDDDWDMDCHLSEALPSQLQELRLIIDDKFSTKPEKTLKHLLEHRQEAVAELRLLIIDADVRWLQKKAAAVLELEETCEEEEIDCVILRNGARGSYVSADAPKQDLSPWPRTAGRIRSDWRELLVM